MVRSIVSVIVAGLTPKEQIMEKVVIIGTGAAGLTAAIYAARANLEPLVVEGLQPGGQLTTTTEVENYPGFEKGITGPELMDVMHKQAERFGTRFVYDTVGKVDFSGPTHKVFLDGGDVLESQSVIIATGATARYLGIENEQKLIGHGVSACATCDGAFFRNVPIAVVGGGDTAMEEAVFLTRFASKVYLIHRRHEFRASRIMADRALANPKIVPVWNSVVTDVFEVSQKKVTGIELTDTVNGGKRRLEVDGLFVAIGHQPNTAPFKGILELDQTGYIITKNTRTNVPGVFAAGDVQDSVYRQAITAAGTGCMAALEAERYLESLHG